MLEVSEALEQVLARARPLAPEMTALATNALGLVLAEDVLADADSPPFDKSMMDGFAVRSVDCPGGLQVVGEAAAGTGFPTPLGPGEAIEIYTGAPIPPGADAVVMIEQTERLPEGRVRIPGPITPGRNILTQGSHQKTGEVVVPRGTLLNPTTFGLFASVGKTAVPTIQMPRVALVATGNELVEANRRPRPGQIRNSNGPMLAAQSVRAGALPRYIGLGPDDPVVLSSLFREGLETAHVLILAGGVSIGKYDLVPQVLRDIGVEIHFHQVRMKPGKPLLFGTFQDRLVFGLPGNPVSAAVGFELFVRPALRVLRGEADPGPSRMTARLTARLQTQNDRPTYHPAFLTSEALVRPLPWSGSADLRGLLSANALLVLPSGEVAWEVGTTVEVLSLL